MRCLTSDNAGDVAHRARGGAAHRLQPRPCERLTLSISTAAVAAPQYRRHRHARIPGGGRASASLNRSRANASISSSVSPWSIRKVCIRIVSPMMELESQASRRAKHALASDITPRLGAFVPDGRCPSADAVLVLAGSELKGSAPRGDPRGRRQLQRLAPRRELGQPRSWQPSCVKVRANAILRRWSVRAPRLPQSVASCPGRLALPQWRELQRGTAGSPAVCLRRYCIDVSIASGLVPPQDPEPPWAAPAPACAPGFESIESVRSKGRRCDASSVGLAGEGWYHR